jgi:DNA-binding NtrC family response regulator
MHILLINEQDTNLLFPLRRILQDLQLQVVLCKKFDELEYHTSVAVPDLIIIVGREPEQRLRVILLALQQNIRTLSKPVILIIQHPASKTLLDEFHVQIKAVFVQPFLIDEFIETIRHFAEP